MINADVMAIVSCGLWIHIDPCLVAGILIYLHSTINKLYSTCSTHQAVLRSDNAR
jgi:hypothetical protein